MSAVLLVIYLVGAICMAWCLGVPTMNSEQRPVLSMAYVIWPLTVTVFGLLVLIAWLTHWYVRLTVALPDQRADLQESRGAVDVPLRFPRSRLLLAALLAISLIDNSPVVPQTKAAARESIASAAAEFVHDRVQIEVPRIITWRPLPVATPAPRRRARPRSASTPTPNRESGDEG